MSVVIIGAGVMGETLLAGVLRSGRAAAEVTVVEKRPARAAELAERYGVSVVDGLDQAADADTIALVVKPQDIATVLGEIGPRLRPGQLVISLAAGITTKAMERDVPEGVAVIRVMPNTPALVGAGMSAISPGRWCEESHLAETEALLSSTGRVIRVPESQQDAVTAVSGSGPAYVFLVVESMVEAGVHLGLTREIATELAVQTVLGAATMLSETGDHPTLLRERVTSPGGTTAAALRQLEDHKLRAAFTAAMFAARDHSAALAAPED